MINKRIEYEKGIAMASEVLLSISRDEAERTLFMNEHKYEADTQSKVVDAKREGLRKGRQETAWNLKKSGVSFEQIAQITGLIEERFKDL
jgi:hypothetical protein